MNLIYYWLFLTGLVSIVVLFLMSNFVYRLPFTLLMFIILISLYPLLFRKDSHPLDISRSGAHKFGALYSSDFLLYCLGLVSSLIVLATSPFEITIYSNSVMATFLSLTPLALAKIISGLFLLSIFPGCVVYKNFLRKYGFSWFERIGLFLVLSYCISGFLGLIIMQTSFLYSPAVILASIWLFVFVIEIIRKVSEGSSVKSDFTERIRISHESLLLLSVSLILLIGCYGIVLFTGPITGVTGGDIAQYLLDTNTLVHFGYASTGYVYLYSYLWIGHSLTNLPLVYVYASIQYLVLLVPVSVYIFMRRLFPNQKSAAPVATLFVSLLLGMTSIPSLANLFSSPTGFGDYLNGVTGPLMSSASKLGDANTGVFVLSASTLDYALAFFALAFLFSFLSKSGKVRDLFLGAILLNIALFTHFFFTFLFSVGTIFVFSLLQNVSKKKLFALAGLSILVFLLLDFSSNHAIGNFFLLFLYIEPVFSPTGVRATATYNFSILFVALLSVYLIILFRREILSKKRVTFKFNVLTDKLRSLSALKTVRISLWAIGLSLLFLAIALVSLNLSNIAITEAWNNPYYIYPWYLVISYWGVCVPIIFGTLPKILEKCNKVSLKFVCSSLITICGLAIIFYFTYTPGLPAAPSSTVNRYLFFMSFPLSCLAALGITTLFNNQSEMQVCQNE